MPRQTSGTRRPTRPVQATLIRGDRTAPSGKSVDKRGDVCRTETCVHGRRGRATPPRRRTPRTSPQRTADTPPSGALRVRLQPHTPVRDPPGPYPRADPGRPRTSSPGTPRSGLSCTPTNPTAAREQRRGLRASVAGQREPSTAARASTAATAADGHADSNVRARNDAGAPRQRVYPVRDAATAAAAAPAAAGGRRGKGSRRRQTCGVAVPAAAPGCHHHPRLPPPPPAAAAAPARHDPLLATSVAAPAAFPRHHPPVEQTCPPLTPGLGGYGARGARRPPRDAATTSRAAQWDAAAAAIRSG